MVFPSSAARNLHLGATFSSHLGRSEAINSGRLRQDPRKNAPSANAPVATRAECECACRYSRRARMSLSLLAPSAVRPCKPGRRVRSPSAETGWFCRAGCRVRSPSMAASQRVSRVGVLTCVFPVSFSSDASRSGGRGPHSAPDTTKRPCFRGRRPHSASRLAGANRTRRPDLQGRTALADTKRDRPFCVKCYDRPAAAWRCYGLDSWLKHHSRARNHGSMLRLNRLPDTSSHAATTCRNIFKKGSCKAYVCLL